MARPGRPERNKAARSFRQLRRFLHAINSNKVFGTHSRAYKVGGHNDAVPLPKLPGNANQTPTRELDQFFTALVDWVEKGVAPGEIMLTSRDNSVSFPVCVYPLMTTWNGSGPATQASSYTCK
jgi:feruloyl esterase